MCVANREAVFVNCEAFNIKLSLFFIKEKMISVKINMQFCIITTNPIEYVRIHKNIVGMSAAVKKKTSIHFT